jgi:hypothetical protein
VLQPTPLSFFSTHMWLVPSQYPLSLHGWVAEHIRTQPPPSVHVLGEQACTDGVIHLPPPSHLLTSV